jgi:signal peptide peptidase SppA
VKKFPNVINKLFYEPLLITRARHQALCRVVEAHMARVDLQKEDDGDDDEEDQMGYVATNATAIIPVKGVLVAHASDIPMSSCGCGLDEVSAMIDVALEDPTITKIVFYFDTPGGGVTGIPELGRKIAGITSKQTVAFWDSECCSGGMWLAMQCQQAYCTESSSSGSIGVWCAYLDISSKLERDGQNVQEFSAGKYKTMGAYWKPLTKEEGTLIQDGVDKIYAQFKEAVQTRRVVSDEYMEGQIFDGPEAVDAGLVDGLVESIEEVI